MRSIRASDLISVSNFGYIFPGQLPGRLAQRPLAVLRSVEFAASYLTLGPFDSPSPRLGYNAQPVTTVIN